MSKHGFTRLFANLILFSVSLWWGDAAVCSTASETVRNTSVPEARRDVTTILQATGPHASLGDQGKVFDRIVGTWDAEYTHFSTAGKVSHTSGELVVGWIMDGRAIQELWISYPSSARSGRQVYTTVRYFDPGSGKWPGTFFDPQQASTARFTGGAVADDRMVFDTTDFDHKATRWSFSEMHPETFIYREEESSDGGRIWHLQLEGHMKRRVGTHLRDDRRHSTGYVFVLAHSCGEPPRCSKRSASVRWFALTLGFETSAPCSAVL